MFVPMTNLHKQPRDFYKMDLSTVIRYHVIHGIFHSHPSGELEPSFADMQSQISWDIPFYICTLSRKNTFMDFFGWGDQLPVPSLTSRTFRSGVNDCYSLYRHWKWLNEGVLVPEYPRDRSFYDGSVKTPFEDPDALGLYEEVPLSDARPGDGLLFTLRRGRNTHCGVYTGQGLLMHHLHGKISKEEPLQPWARFLHKVMRYRGNE